MSLQARVCVWADLSLTDAESLIATESLAVEVLQEKLRTLLSLDGELSKQAMIELDLYTYAVLFARKQGFNAEQTSAFFTILKSVHSLCISTPFDNQSEAFQYFKDLMLCHSINRPPHSTCLYSIAQVREVTEYVLQTYFKHYKLYKYAFTKRVRLDLKLSYDGETELVEQSQTQLDEEIQLPQEENEIAEVAPEEEVEVEAAETVPPPNPLQLLIAEKLSEKMKELNVTVEQQLSEQEKRVNERISVLESASGRSSKKGK